MSNRARPIVPETRSARDAGSKAGLINYTRVIQITPLNIYNILKYYIMLHYYIIPYPPQLRIRVRGCPLTAHHFPRYLPPSLPPSFLPLLHPIRSLPALLHPSPLIFSCLLSSPPFPPSLPSSAVSAPLPPCPSPFSGKCTQQGSNPCKRQYIPNVLYELLQYS